MAGRVKTRLSPSLPPALAAELYSALLSDTLEAGRACRADTRTIWWAEDRDGVPRPEGFVPKLQSGADRGARLANAFEALLTSPGDRAIVVVADLPALSASHLDRAFSALERHDVVMGPATGGGCWLVGLSRRSPALFEDAKWADGGSCEDARAAVRGAGLTLRELEPLPGLDTPADLVRLAAAAAAGALLLGETAAASLRRMGLLPE